MKMKMANYLFSIVAASVFVAVICAAAPDGEGVGKFVGFAGALTVALVALSPLAGGVDEWMDNIQKEWETETGQSSEQDMEQNAKYLAYNIALTTSEIYNLALEDISVFVYPSEDQETFAADEVRITLPVGVQIDTENASDTLSQLFSCTVLVQIE